MNENFFVNVPTPRPRVDWPAVLAALSSAPAAPALSSAPRTTTPFLDRTKFALGMALFGFGPKELDLIIVKDITDHDSALRALVEDAAKLLGTAPAGAVTQEQIDWTKRRDAFLSTAKPLLVSAVGAPPPPHGSANALAFLLSMMAVQAPAQGPGRPL